MERENVRWRVEDGVGVATVDRPRALNAIDSRTIAELSSLLDDVERDPAVRALVVTGAGDRAFVAGADIAEMAALTPVEAQRFSEAGQRVFARLEGLSIPTLAAVNGVALGGGCELAMACDLLYASEKARLGQPEVTLGLVPGFGATQRLARRVGAMRACELLFTGDTLDAARAKAIGLVLDVLAPQDLLAHVVAQARKIASRGPLAVAAVKRALRRGIDVDLAAGCALERAEFGLIFSTEDAREGMRAFLEKRAARFTGR